MRPARSPHHPVLNYKSSPEHLRFQAGSSPQPLRCPFLSRTHPLPSVCLHWAIAYGVLEIRHSCGWASQRAWHPHTWEGKVLSTELRSSLLQGKRAAFELFPGPRIVCFHLSGSGEDLEVLNIVGTHSINVEINERVEPWARCDPISQTRSEGSRSRSHVRGGPGAPKRGNGLASQASTQPLSAGGPGHGGGARPWELAGSYGYSAESLPAFPAFCVRLGVAPSLGCRPGLARTLRRGVGTGLVGGAVSGRAPRPGRSRAVRVRGAQGGREGGGASRAAASGAGLGRSECSLMAAP